MNRSKKVMDLTISFRIVKMDTAKRESRECKYFIQRDVENSRKE